MQAELETTSATLVDVRGALASTTAELEDTTVLAAAHAGTERALTAESLLVAASLAASVGDVGGLHAKVARTVATEAANATAARSFRGDVLSCVTGMMDEAASFEVAQSKQCVRRVSRDGARCHVTGRDVT